MQTYWAVPANKKNDDGASLKQKSYIITIIAAWGVLLVGEVASMGLRYLGTADISVLSSATQDWLLSPEGTAIVFVAPVVLAAIAGLIAWNFTPQLPTSSIPGTTLK